MDLIEEAELGAQTRDAACEEGNPSYTTHMNVLRYDNCKEMPQADYWECMEFGGLIPDRSRQLDENDFLLVLTTHMKGKAVGYTVITFELEWFWFTAYGAFLTCL